jgi:hypothetical protein
MYYHRHQIATCGCLTFAITPISEAPDHVVSQTKQVLEEWKKTIRTCQEFAKMEELNAQAMEAIQWKTTYECARNREKYAYLGTHPLMLQAAITRTQHLMKKLAT